MRTDITAPLSSAARSRDEWSVDRTRSLLVSILDREPEARLDWDEEDGEEWARILVAEFLVALVRRRTPLCIVLKGEASIAGAIPETVTCVVVDDADLPTLCASRTALEAAFPERRLSPLDATAFSVNDLWFATT